MKIPFVLPILILTAFIASPLSAQATVSPSEVYAQAEQIQKEVSIVMKHLKIPSKHRQQTFKAQLQPRHVWQKTYFILVKINVFRNKHKLPRNSLGSLEPVLQIEPILPYEQTQRILTEFAIIKKRLNIKTKATAIRKHIGKKPIDVFNKLHHVSMMIDELNQESINPSYVFAEALRAYEDVSHIIVGLRIEDKSFPPAKGKNIQSRDSLEQAWNLMQESQRLQKEVGIERVDFSPFYNKENVLPSDVFNMVGMCIVELNVLKAYLKITDLTSQAEYHGAKTPADVHQLLGWSTRRLSQVSLLK